MAFLMLALVKILYVIAFGTVGFVLVAGSQCVGQTVPVSLLTIVA